MHKAMIEDTESGRRPAGDGWFILNLTEMGWETVPGGGTWSVFEAPSAPSSLLGIGVHILQPGETPGMYHAESEQEGFLVLSGECIAIVQGEERRMRAWDYLLDDLDAGYETVMAAGAHEVWPPRQSPEPGRRMAFVHDLDGNLVELIGPPE